MSPESWSVPVTPEQIFHYPCIYHYESIYFSDGVEVSQRYLKVAD